MPRPLFELADVIKRYRADFEAAFGESVSFAQLRVLNDIEACRTTALGGHVDMCDSASCGHVSVSYNSCRDRHCPRCLGTASAEWLEARQAELLPVPYFHVVFTLPSALRGVALQNKEVVYDLLFRAISETLLTIAADPNHLGAKIGFLAILHTWGQNLLDHPHIHCVIPGGGLSPDREQWIPSRGDFFLPVHVLSPLFRGKFLSFLRSAFEDSKLTFHGSLEPLRDPENFAALLKPLYAKGWVVYAKAPFGGPDQVLKYLARYTHRVAISSSRLLSIDGGKIKFRWKDNEQNGRHGTMTLDAVEFIRRFLLHVLPRGFVRIRYYGLMANRHRTENLQLCRRLLDQANPSPAPPSDSPVDDPTIRAEGTAASTDPAPTCPKCRTGHMRFLRTLRPFESFVPRQTCPPSHPT